VQAVHWVGSAEYCQKLPKEFCAHFSDTPTPFCWPEAPLLDHLLLQNLIHSILLDEVELALIGQTLPQGSAVMLLASPHAIGRHNIMPSARVESCRAFPDKIDPAILKGVPLAHRIDASKGGVVWQMNALVQTMLAKKRSGGLLRSSITYEEQPVKSLSHKGTLVSRIELV
ncbi:MAG TPA: hypothetical protein VMC62_04280, partial [Longilinea sp.]|nr:hypothetical protein [Longilinea sp.]